MPEWSESYITTNGIKIHYYRTGGNKPPVVINHGASEDGLCWTGVAKQLEADYDIIMPDARGHGKSDSGNGNYAADARAADLAGLIKELDLDRPIIGGHSMGADTAVFYAAVYPNGLRGLFLEDLLIVSTDEAPKFGPFSINPWKMIVHVLHLFRFVFGCLPERFTLPLTQRMFPALPDDELLPWIMSKGKFQPDFSKAAGDPSLIIGLSDYLKLFDKITVPVMMFLGDQENMAFMSQETAQEIMARHKNVDSIHLAGASHFIRYTRFDGYMPALQTFLSRTYQHKEKEYATH